MAAGDSSLPAGRRLESLRSARSAAVAGLIFAVTLVAVLVLFRSAFPMDGLTEQGATPTPEALDRGRWALILLPYAGIAFIWFMAALNYSLGHADHRLFTTVFLASGIIFVGLAFVAGAVASAELEAYIRGIDLSGSSRIIPGTTVNALLANYASRMAAVFCLSLATFGRVRKLMPSWLTILGTLTGLFLLLVPFGVRYVEYVFPIWVAIVSVYLIVTDPGGRWRDAQQAQEQEQD
ncbi:MAG: hypothetical protein ACKOT0_03415 [bacterium]